MVKCLRSDILHHPVGDHVVDMVHQPLGNGSDGNHNCHFSKDSGQFCKIHMTCGNDTVHGITNQNRKV